MAGPRRRERRAVSSGAGTASPSSRPPQMRSQRSTRSWKLLLFSFAFFVLLVAGYIFVQRRGPKRVVSGTRTALTVTERGLVKTDVSYREIIQESPKASENTSRNFPNLVLAYVTPWNSLGYEMAENFSSKFSHISPVWYELKSEGKKLFLEGRHNADLKWISRIRAHGQPLVVPRIVLEAHPLEYLQKKQQRNKVVNIIVNECKEMGYDGVVLESWSRWAAYGVLHDASSKNMGLELIKQLGKALHATNVTSDPSHHLELVFVIPAPRSLDLNEHDFSTSDFQLLSEAVDGFSLMTYDFSGYQNPGPNAPLIWINSCLRLFLGDNDSRPKSLSRKIFVGINFYGNDFLLSEGLGGGAITGRDYISLLEKYKPRLIWEDRSAEHYFIYSANGIKHAVFYPSPMSLSLRLDDAKTWGVGLSIWEIGQGLHYFFDLL